MCYLQNKVDIVGPMSFLHEECQAYSSRAEYETENRVNITNGSTRIVKHYPWDKSKSYTEVRSASGRMKIIKAKKQNQRLQEMIETSNIEHCRDRYTFVQNININVIVKKDDDEDVRAEKDFIDVLEEKDRETIRQQFRCVDDDRIYVRNLTTNRWELGKKYVIDTRLIELLHQHVDLNEKETKRVRAKKYISNLRHFFSAMIDDGLFEQTLDSNLDLFAFDNGVLVNGKNFRDIAWDDYVSTSCGWSYSKQESDRYMPDVRAFFESILPNKEVRDYVRHHFARLFVGHRIEKRFMVFTDKRGM